MVKQIVIAGGGIGSRMSIDINHHGSKLLIEYERKPLIHHLLRNARVAGITEFLISVNEHNRERVEKIATSLGLEYITVLTAPGFRGVPLIFGNDLDDKFIFMCGHHPVPSEYLFLLIQESHHYAVSSEYSMPKEAQRDIRIIRENGSFSLEHIAFNHPLDGNFLESPHVITKDMALEMKARRFNVSWPFLIYQMWLSKRNVKVLQPHFQYEFDSDSEFHKFIQSLKLER